MERPNRKAGGKTLPPRENQEYVVFVRLSSKDVAITPKPKAQACIMSMASLVKLRADLESLARKHGLFLELHAYRFTEAPRRMAEPSMIGICRVHGQIEAGKTCGACGGPVVYVLIDKATASDDIPREVGRVKTTG